MASVKRTMPLMRAPSWFNQLATLPATVELATVAATLPATAIAPIVWFATLPDTVESTIVSCIADPAP